MRFRNFGIVAWFCAVIVAAASSMARADVVYDETGMDPDISGNYLMPTPIGLSYGTNSVVLTVHRDEITFLLDLDLFRIDLPVGGTLTKLILAGASSESGRSFIGFEDGAVWSFDPDENTGDPNVCAEPGGCLGFTHFGPAEASFGAGVGDNLLIPMQENGFGTLNGFDIPLTGSQYVFWVQETSEPVEQYILDFVVSIPGDYNGDLLVNAADYTVWRNTLGQSVAAGEGADGDRDAMVDIDDYLIWKETYGLFVGGSGAANLDLGSNVPEPSTALLLLIGSAAAIVSAARRRRG